MTLYILTSWHKVARVMHRQVVFMIVLQCEMITSLFPFPSVASVGVQRQSTRGNGPAAPFPGGGGVSGPPSRSNGSSLSPRPPVPLLLRRGVLQTARLASHPGLLELLSSDARVSWPSNSAVFLTLYKGLDLRMSHCYPQKLFETCWSVEIIHCKHLMLHAAFSVHLCISSFFRFLSLSLLTII